MTYRLGYDITTKAKQILIALFIYRGMTAAQLADMLLAPLCPSLSEEKSIYNFLRKLKKQGLVTSQKLQANVRNGSIYYLTQKGYELALHLLNVQIDSPGEGWIEKYYEFGYEMFADLSYEVYRPPLKQTAHHLLLIDFIIEMKRIEDGYVIDHRLNLYASQKYYIGNDEFHYRPDAEIKFWKEPYDVFTIEIDRGTEDFEQLEAKFETYKRYFDYLKASGQTDKIPKAIIFVGESKRRMHGIKRRWATILKAFWKKLKDYSLEVNLIYTTMDQVERTLLFEMNRTEHEEKAITKVHDVLKQKGFIDTTSYQDTATKRAVFSHGIKKDGYSVIFNSIATEFESFIYARYLDFFKTRLLWAKEVEKVKNLTYKGYGRIVFYQSMKPFIFNAFDIFDLEEQEKKILNTLAENSTKFVELD